MSEQNSKANDYALAKHLDECVAAIFALVASHRSQDLPDLSGINRSYVLLVHELKQLHGRNPELSAIRTNICWRTFRTIDAIDPYDLYEYSTDYPTYEVEHISDVNSLCIMAGKTEPDIPPELKKLLDEAGKNIAAFTTELDKMNATLKFENMTVPEVFIGTEKYRLPAMREGLPKTIIPYCLEKHPNQSIAVGKLKSELKTADIATHGINNLRENIKRSHFGDNRPLSPFIEVSPGQILVKKTTELTDEQIDDIKAASK